MDITTASQLRIEALAALDAANRAWREAKAAALVGLEIKHQPIVSAAQKAWNDAEQALREATDAATADHEWEGRRVFRMVRPRGVNFYMRSNVPEVREEGVVETVRQTSEFAGNLSSYSRPKIGDVIVRSLKKDGSPALKFDKLDSRKPWSLVSPSTPEKGQ